LRTTKFAYNNKIYLATKVFSFKANYGQDPRMGFERRRRGKYKVARKFIEKIKKTQEEAKVMLGKAQEEISVNVRL